MNGESIIQLTNLRELHLSENECIDLDFFNIDNTNLENEARIITEKCGFRESSADEAIDSDHLFNFLCGKVFYNQGFVVGGNETVRGQWPFIVALYLGQEIDQFFCGGVLISPQHVLTGKLTS